MTVKLKFVHCILPHMQLEYIEITAVTAVAAMVAILVWQLLLLTILTWKILIFQHAGDHMEAVTLSCPCSARDSSRDKDSGVQRYRNSCRRSDCIDNGNKEDHICIMLSVTRCHLKTAENFIFRNGESKLPLVISSHSVGSLWCFLESAFWV